MLIKTNIRKYVKRKKSPHDPKLTTSSVNHCGLGMNGCQCNWLSCLDCSCDSRWCQQDGFSCEQMHFTCSAQTQCLMTTAWLERINLVYFNLISTSFRSFNKNFNTFPCIKNIHQKVTYYRYLRDFTCIPVSHI